MFKALFLLSILATACVSAEHTKSHELRRGLSSSDDSDDEQELSITLRNIAYSQPMSKFFVVVHNDKAPALFEVGSQATDGLAALAEDADTTLLEGMFVAGTTRGVGSVLVVPNMEGPNALLEDGEETTFTVTVSRKYPYVSMASMAVNTNDCFVGINAMKLKPGMKLTTPGYDSGTELNNEDCAFIPGPAW